MWVHAEVFGCLRLVSKAGGADFTDDDERLVGTLAWAAGVGLDNARQYRGASSRNLWHEATTEITGLLLADGDLESREALQLIASRAKEVAGGHLGAVLLRDGDELVTEAIDCPALAWTGWPATGFRLTSRRSRTWSAGVRASWPAARRAQTSWHSFANQATLALDRVQAQQDRARLAALEDRDRIARDLHDLVIQRRFATGLHLQGMHRMVSPGARERIRRAVQDIDSTIEELRAAIYELHKDPDRTSLREDVEQIVDE